MSLGVGATHGSSSNGDIMYLICHIISQDHLIDGWEFFAKWPHPDKIGDYRHNDGGDMMFLIRHMFLIPHVTICLKDYVDYGWKLLI